jgi:hypothetical protein
MREDLLSVVLVYELHRDARDNGLFQVSQTLLQTANVASCHEWLTSQNAFLTAGFVGKQVVSVRFEAFHFACTGNFEAVFQTAVRFHLRHSIVPP